MNFVPKQEKNIVTEVHTMLGIALKFFYLKSALIYIVWYLPCLS